MPGLGAHVQSLAAFGTTLGVVIALFCLPQELVRVIRRPAIAVSTRAPESAASNPASRIWGRQFMFPRLTRLAAPTCSPACSQSLVRLGLPLTRHVKAAKDPVHTASLFIAAQFGCRFQHDLSPQGFGHSRQRMRVWVLPRWCCCPLGSDAESAEVGRTQVVGHHGWATVFPDEPEHPNSGPETGNRFTSRQKVDDPDALAEVVVELVHQNMYPRLLKAMNRGLEVAFGDVSLCAKGIRRQGEERCDSRGPESARDRANRREVAHCRDETRS